MNVIDALERVKPANDCSSDALKLLEITRCIEMHPIPQVEEWVVPGETLKVNKIVFRGAAAPGQHEAGPGCFDFE